MANDPLLQMIEEHLADMTDLNQTRDDLIYDVVAEYIFLLMNQGNIPHFLLDEIEVDLREEVLLIYRKKTYGCQSLRDYRSRKASRRSGGGAAPRSGRS